MQSGQVNAAQLLASVLGSENEKIGQSIVNNDFAGELNKLMPQSANPAKSGTRATALNGAANLEQANGADPGLLASTAATPAAPAKKCCQPSSTGVQKSAADSRSKVSAIKSKAQQEENLYVTNPAIAETVLADLQYPAEIRKAYIQNNDGNVSIKDLKSFLDTQPATGTQTGAKVPAEHVRALVESIISRQVATNQKQSASEGDPKSSVQVKTGGSYSPDEFRGLLEKVLQGADAAQTQLAGLGTQSGPAETQKTVEGLKTGRIESLAVTGVPSFASTSQQNDSITKIFTGNSNNIKPEAQGTKVRDAGKSSIEAVSNNLKPGEGLSAASIASQGEDPEEVAKSMEAAIKVGGSAPSQGSPPVSSPAPAQGAAANMPVEGLDPILNNFDARIVSLVSQQPEAKTVETPGLGGPDAGLAAQAQNLAPQVKGVEKQADRPQGALSSSRVQQDVTEQSAAALIKTASTEYPSNESSADSTPNQASDPTRKTRLQQPSEKLDPDKLRPQFQETLRSVETDGKENTLKAAQAQSPTGKSSGPVEGFANMADLPPAVPSTKQIAINPDGVQSPGIGTVEVPVQLSETIDKVTGKSASAVAGDVPAETGGKSTARSESPGVLSGSDYSIENLHSGPDQSAFGEVSNSGASLHEIALATTGTEALKAVESNATLRGQQDVVMLAKQVDKQLSSRDSATEAAFFQNSASSQQGNQINLTRMDNSPHNGFAFYDPYRSAELVQNMREQMPGALGNQLVLEMEPDGLGKINIKVGAKKDEISVVALTQSEPAREALMRSSSELRQNLQDQGLVLGKFMVDVNGDKSGGGNYPEANQAKTTPPPKAAKVRSVQTQDTNVYITKAADRSQINIFA